MDGRLQLAEELERRDARAAAELAEVERLERDVGRARAEAGRLADARAEVEFAEAGRRHAEERGREDEQLAAARALRHAADALRESEGRLERARAERARLATEEEAQRRRAAALEEETHELAARL